MTKHLLALAALVSLAACNSPLTDYPGGNVQPNSISLGINVSVLDASLHAENQNVSSSVTLISGHLPSNPFANQKNSIAALVNNSSTIDASKKTDLIAGANTALDKLEADINTALDALPNSMTIMPTSNHIGDLAEANFIFANKNGKQFSVTGAYNTATSEYLLAGLGFMNGTANSQGALFSFGAWKFSGDLNKTTASLSYLIDGALALSNVGAINIAASLDIGMGFTRSF